jgi:hypothetical protein
MFKRLPARYRELVTKDVTDTLETLREEILNQGNHLRAKREPGSSVNMDDLKACANTVFRMIEQKGDVLGLPRRIRLLRHRARPVFGIDPSAATEIEPTIAWFDQIVENIESELDLIDRKRVMWLTLAAAVLSAVAVLLAMIAVARS